MVLIKPESTYVATFIPFHCIRELFHPPRDMRVHQLHLSDTPTAITPYPPSSCRPVSQNAGTVVQPKRPERRGRLRRKVISAVSPQRFPHSTVISSNNVSQSSQLLRRMGAERRHAEATRWLGIHPPHPTQHFAPLIFLSTVLASEVMLT